MNALTITLLALGGFLILAYRRASLGTWTSATAAALALIHFFGTGLSSLTWLLFIAAAAIWTEIDEGEDLRCAPDVMILSSPAVSLHHDRWVKKLLGDRAEAADVSPDQHVRPGMPPTLILQGRTDTVTPLEGTQRFHDAMLAAGNESVLIVYDDVGHLFTPSTESDKGRPNPDPAVNERAKKAMEEFLRARGFIDDAVGDSLATPQR